MKKIIILFIIITISAMSDSIIESKEIILNSNVRIKIPNSWTIHSVKHINSVNSEVKNILDNMEQKATAGDIGKTLIMAKTEEGFASVKLDVLSPSMHPSAIMKISKKELDDFSEILKKQYVKMLSLQKMRLIKYNGLSKTFFNNHPVLRIRYIRSGISNNYVVVETFMIYTLKKEYRLVLSYDKNNSKLKKEINFIKSSIVISESSKGLPDIVNKNLNLIPTESLNPLPHQNTGRELAESYKLGAGKEKNTWDSIKSTLFGD